MQNCLSLRRKTIVNHTRRLRLMEAQTNYRVRVFAFKTRTHAAYLTVCLAWFSAKAKQSSVANWQCIAMRRGGGGQRGNGASGE